MIQNHKKILWGILIWVLAFPCFALQERHLILIRQGGAYALTEEGQQAIKQTGDVLLTHGFDNRSISAVYVAPDKGSKQCAKTLIHLGLITQNKIYSESRLSHKNQTNNEDWPAFIARIEKTNPKGHIILIDDSTQTSKVIAQLTKSEQSGVSTQPYILPLTPSKE